MLVLFGHLNVLCPSKGFPLDLMTVFMQAGIVTTILLEKVKECHIDCSFSLRCRSVCCFVPERFNYIQPGTV